MDVPKIDLTKNTPLFGWQEQNEQVLMRCPNGHIADLSTHTIKQDGTVDPSAQCPKCDFHEDVKLIGY